MAEKLELSAILKLNASEFVNGVSQAQKKLGDLGTSAEKSNAQVKDAIPKINPNDIDNAAPRTNPSEHLQKTQKATADLNAETDKLANSTNNAEGKFSGLAEGLGGLIAPLAGAVSAMGALQFGMESLQQAGEDERWELGLREQVAFTGNAAKLTVEQMKDLTEQVTSNTFATEDSARKSVSVMASFMSVQDENFTRSIYLAQDLAEVLGSDMSGAAMQLGKALENPANGISAMADSGVTFTEQQKQVIMSLVETGQKAEAQKLIMDAVAGQLGNTGAAAAKGYAGAVDQMAKSWDSFKGAIGATLLEGAANSVRSLTATIKDLSEAYQLTFGSDKQAGDAIAQTLSKSKELGNKGLKADNAANLNATQQNQLRDGLIQQISALDTVKSELDTRIDMGRSVDMEKYTQLTAQLRQYKQELATVNQVMNTNGVQKYGTETSQVLSQIKDKSAQLVEQRTKYDERVNEKNKSLIDQMLSGNIAYNAKIVQRTKFKVDEIVKLEQQLADKQRDIADKQRDIAKQKADKNESVDDMIRSKQRSNMTEEGQQEDIAKQAEEKLAKAKKAAAAGDQESAKKFADEAISLANSLEDVEQSIALMNQGRGVFNASFDQDRLKLDKEAANLKNMQENLDSREGSTTKMEVDISSAENSLGNLMAQFDQIREQTITLNVDSSKLNSTLNELQAAGVVDKGAFPTAQKFAEGGQLAGFGGGDRIPALLEAGEFVINKTSTREFNSLLHLINYNPEKAAQFLPKFATGGPVVPDLQVPEFPDFPQFNHSNGTQNKPSQGETLRFEWQIGKQQGAIKTFMSERQGLSDFANAFHEAARGLK